MPSVFATPPAGSAAWRWRGLALALLAGILHTAAFAPLEWWWLQIAALALVAWPLRSAPTAARGAALGVAFGLGWFASGLWWLFISMHRYGGLPSVVAALAVALLALALSLYTAAAFAAFVRWRPSRPAAQGLLFAAVWLLAELARASWFSGFPWLASGYAHTSGPLAPWAPWVGVYGLSALSAALAFGLILALPSGAGARPLPLLVVALVAAGAWALPKAFTTSTGALTVSLLQPNVAQDLKFEPARMAANFDRLARDVEAAHGQLVVTPESVVPIPLNALDPVEWQRLQRAVSGPGRAALVGVFVGDDTRGYVNSMVALSAASDGTGPRAYVYGKQHLLPFGEVIPFGFKWFVRAMNIPLDDQERGHNSAAFAVGGQRLRPLICYEDLFGEDIVGSAVGEGAATVFVNASNLAWFGLDMVQDQHLQFSRMRALEFQRPFIRSTNTGATAVVDHRGQVTARLAPGVAGTLDATVEGRQGSTPYARWLAKAGLWPLWALGLLGALFFAKRRR